MSSKPDPSRRAGLAMACMLALTGCGFSPLYASGNAATGTPGVGQRLDEVQIQNIPERTGQLLRESLQAQFYTAGQPTVQHYMLNVSYSITTQGIGVQEDTATTRNRFVAIAHWTLAPIGEPTKPLASGQASTENAANVIDQQYFALTLETNTINQQLADTIAAQVTAQVATYFKTHPQA